MYLKEKIKNTLKVLPKKPGIYIFKDEKGRIIYVGKAKNLADRVKSYFVPSSTVSYVNHPISFFKQKIDSVDFIVTDNEIEALILESNLIKKNRPKYNVYLKDDKSYPYVAITVNEKFPRVFVTRNRNIKGARYYGPYTNVKDIKKTLDILRRLFLVRDCKKAKPGKIKDAACLNYHINLCSAPCTGKISEEDYKKNIDYIKLFLKGKDKKIVRDLEKEMHKLSAEKKFEDAAEIKDKIIAINGIFTYQKILFSGEDAWDILAVAMDVEERVAVVSVYSYRTGELAAIGNYIVSSAGLQTENDIISGFIKSYYSEIDNISSVIYIPSEIEDMETISRWLSEAKGKKILIKTPRKGDKKKISRMAEKNAELYLEKKKFEKGSGYSRVFAELLKLQKQLGLQNIPRRIECFDISNIGPSFAVGSMAVFTDGSPLKSNYRHFKINTVSGQDDFAMISEVVARRLRYLEGTEIDIEDSFYKKPDLIVVDGGKAQFGSARRVLMDKKILDIDLISIAKKEEIIFSNGYPDGIKADIAANHIRVILKIRDEAHRFAIEYHRKLREKHMTNSILDGIRGIGEKKKRIILEKYGTPEELRACRLEDLLNIRGLNYGDAVNIYNSLNRY